MWNKKTMMFMTIDKMFSTCETAFLKFMWEWYFLNDWTYPFCSPISIFHNSHWCPAFWNLIRPISCFCFFVYDLRNLSILHVFYKLTCYVKCICWNPKLHLRTFLIALLDDRRKNLEVLIALLDDRKKNW